MPGATMGIDWSQLEKYFDGLESKLAHVDYHGALRDTSIYLASEAKQNFQGGHEPDGTPWAPLKSTVRKKGRNSGPAAKPLRDTDLLMASLAGVGVGHFEHQTERALTWGTAVDYGFFHQFGAPRANIPARPFIGITDVMEEKIAKILLFHVERQLGFGGNAP